MFYKFKRSLMLSQYCEIFILKIEFNSVSFFRHFFVCFRSLVPYNSRENKQNKPRIKC